MLPDSANSCHMARPLSVPTSHPRLPYFRSSWLPTRASPRCRSAFCGRCCRRSSLALFVSTCRCCCRSRSSARFSGFH
ncbi:hypothetical protein MPTK1_4g06270 [Marchantia polymorpha subsp. ruderalis]|uniref:Uncharacterized protein n=2 Tax=Marchantia polymorpha TaxID=3197 RepID=A0AAF6B6Y2_MARPO|nr:hypothetical protein MARPO_0114s0026 [Marchantia polymorpha]BBN07766.1 hypothetical protein Mp_4g06270 [Marchantia polymorpha subsp. ruderalis]|eukprot:PTQ31206.1 hypothetical protein MARPO_0114s0026 [Marchantia polymorpha]